MVISNRLIVVNSELSKSEFYRPLLLQFGAGARKFSAVSSSITDEIQRVVVEVIASPDLRPCAAVLSVEADI